MSWSFQRVARLSTPYGPEALGIFALRQGDQRDVLLKAVEPFKICLAWPESDRSARLIWAARSHPGAERFV